MVFINGEHKLHFAHFIVYAFVFIFGFPSLSKHKVLINSKFSTKKLLISILQTQAINYSVKDKQGG